MDPVIVLAKFEVCIALPVPEIIAISLKVEPSESKTADIKTEFDVK